MNIVHLSAPSLLNMPPEMAKIHRQMLPKFVNLLPFAAVGAEVKVHEGFQIGLFKGDPVFVRPQQRPGFLMLNGQAACLKRHGGTIPFLATTVAEKAESEGFSVRAVDCLPGQRFTHIFRL
jgi:hypothetical protein